MKKFLKIFGIVLFFVGVIAFIVCKSVIPEQTDVFVENIKVFMDRPIIIAGFTVTVGSVLIFFITRYVLNERKFSRSKLNELQEEINNLAKDFENNKNDLVNYIVEHSKDIGKLCDLIDNNFNKTEEILKLIPNKKVQEALKHDENNSTEASN